MGGDHTESMGKAAYVRYERKHSNSLWHTDLFEKYEGDNVAILYEYDASRMITGTQLLDRSTAANCVTAGKMAVSAFGKPKQLMSDHGTTFTSLPREGCPEPDPNEFQKWLKGYDIDHVKSRVKHPQSNGKVEKGGGILRKLVEHFSSLEHAIY